MVKASIEAEVGGRRLYDIYSDMIDVSYADDRYKDPTAVYRYFTECDRLLYVGISNQPHLRHLNHFAKPWRDYASLLWSRIASAPRVCNSCAIAARASACTAMMH